MPPKTTNAQLRNKLQYDSGAQPAFLRAMRARITGKPDPSSYDEEGFTEDGGEWEQLDSNRPAIPRRSNVEPGVGGSSRNDEDDEDEAGEEKPQVVVLRKGKHLSELEALNEKRRGTPEDYLG